MRMWPFILTLLDVFCLPILFLCESSTFTWHVIVTFAILARAGNVL